MLTSPFELLPLQEQHEMAWAENFRISKHRQQTAQILGKLTCSRYLLIQEYQCLVL